MKIYTKKGDKGETRMLFGDAVSKDDLAPDAYGSCLLYTSDAADE